MSKDHQPEGFFYQPSTIRWILRIFYGLCVILAVVDFFVHRHILTEAEKVPAFYALYGFAACVILVLIATEMRKVVMRDEDYYEKEMDASSDDKAVEGQSND